MKTTAPSITHSTPQERQAYVLSQWQCLGNCELCGKCSVLKGRDVEQVYAPYINGECSYMEVTLQLRSNNR